MEIRAELPKSPVGKILKKELYEQEARAPRLTPADAARRMAAAAEGLTRLKAGDSQARSTRFSRRPLSLRRVSADPACARCRAATRRRGTSRRSRRSSAPKPCGRTTRRPRCTQRFRLSRWAGSTTPSLPPSAPAVSRPASPRRRSCAAARCSRAARRRPRRAPSPRRCGWRRTPPTPGGCAPGRCARPATARARCVAQSKPSASRRDPTLNAWRPYSPAAALGLAVEYLSRKPAFAALPFGEWSQVLFYQVARGHYLFIVDGEQRIQGFIGWALTDQAFAEAWVAGRAGLRNDSGDEGDCASSTPGRPNIGAPIARCGPPSSGCLPTAAPSISSAIMRTGGSGRCGCRRRPIASQRLSLAKPTRPLPAANITTMSTVLVVLLEDKDAALVRR